jgi:hypothetical protein
MLKILSATNIEDLTRRANQYDITDIGSLTITNGQFYITLLGELKTEVLTKEPTEVIKEPAIEPKPKPKTRTKRSKPSV